MSHLTKLDLKLDSLSAVKKALEEMGYQVRQEDQRHTVDSKWGWNMDVDISANKDGVQMPVGFRLNEETGEIETQADWYDMDINQSEFEQKINQLHSKHKTIDTVKKKGYKVANATADENGKIKMKATRWV